MRRRVPSVKSTILRHFAVAGLALLLGSGAAFAQSGTPAPDQNKSAADAAKENQHKTDEFAEAAQAINGPAGNPECVWLGRRVVRLMWVRDLRNAFCPPDLFYRLWCRGG